MTFDARWSKSLIIVSALVTGICIAAALAVGRTLPWLGVLILALPGISLLYCIRGYTVSPGVLLVKRLLWTTEIPLRGLRSADADPTLLAGSWRTFGNGGLFSFSGWFYNRRLGKYRALVTDHRDAVVLAFNDRTVVVSPHPAGDFATQIMSAAR